MMGEDQISPDAEVFWSSGFFNINLTLVTTWAVMALLIIGAWLITRRLSSGPRMSRWQNALEVIRMDQRTPPGVRRRDRRQASASRRR